MADKWIGFDLNTQIPFVAENPGLRYLVCPLKNLSLGAVDAVGAIDKGSAAGISTSLIFGVILR